jgi:hypothetical protein
MENEIIETKINDKEKSNQYADEQTIDRNINNIVEINDNNSVFLEKIKAIQDLIKKESSNKKLRK